MVDHKVLVLRDQHISVEEHIAFGRRFGDLEVHPFAVGKKGYPEVVKIKSTAEYQYAANNWHSDVTWRAEPSMGSILRGVVIPPAGGDTCFADTGAAYQRLSQDWKDRVDPLFAIHDFSMTFGQRLSDEERAEKQALYPPASIPSSAPTPRPASARSTPTDRSSVRSKVAHPRSQRRSSVISSARS